MNLNGTIRIEQFLRDKMLQQSQGCAISKSGRSSCKKHEDFSKLAWSENSSCVRTEVNVTSDLDGVQTKTNVFTKSVDKKSGNHMHTGSKSQGDDGLKLTFSKTRELGGYLSESFKLRTVVKAFRDEKDSTSEETEEDDDSPESILKPDEFIYTAHAPNTRRKAICDEIEKCIVQHGGMLRSQRRDLVLAVNLSNLHLL